MAKLERQLSENFDELLTRIENGILNGSMTATLEAASVFSDGEARCSVRVFERYSFMGGNRLSLSVTLFQNGGDVFLSAVSAGGSQGMLWKVNTFGEHSFLDRLREIL